MEFIDTIILAFLIIYSAIHTILHIVAFNKNAANKRWGLAPEYSMFAIAGTKFMTVAPVVMAGLFFIVIHPSLYTWLVAIGLAVCLLADMLIMPSFIAGLAVFLAGHVVYIFAFCAGRTDFMGPYPQPLAIYALIGIMAYLLLWPKLKAPMKIAVAAYIITIVIMAWQALVRFQYFGEPRMLLAVFGAALFMFSDFILALKTFQPEHQISVWLNLEQKGKAIVMGTYVVAQWLICLSILA